MDGVQSANGSGATAIYAMKKAMQVQEKQMQDLFGSAVQTQTQSVQQSSALAAQTTGKGMGLDIRG